MREEFDALFFTFGSAPCGVGLDTVPSVSPLLRLMCAIRLTQHSETYG